MHRLCCVSMWHGTDTQHACGFIHSDMLLSAQLTPPLGKEELIHAMHCWHLCWFLQGIQITLWFSPTGFSYFRNAGMRSWIPSILLHGAHHLQELEGYVVSQACLYSHTGEPFSSFCRTENIQPKSTRVSFGSSLSLSLIMPQWNYNNKSSCKLCPSRIKNAAARLLGPEKDF